MFHPSLFGFGLDLDWIGLDWIWIGLDWIGFGLDWIWIGLDWIGLERMDWIGADGLDCCFQKKKFHSNVMMVGHGTLNLPFCTS